MPPSSGTKAKPGEAGVKKDGEGQGPGSANEIAEPAEERSAKGPTHHERGLNEGTVMADIGVLGVDMQEFRHQGNSHEGEEVNIETVKKPAEPGGRPGFPLGWGEVAEASGAGGRHAVRKHGRNASAEHSSFARPCGRARLTLA